MDQTERKTVLNSPPRQISNLAWDQAFPLLRQRAAVNVLERLSPDNVDLLRLKGWLEEGIAQFGEKAAHPWKDADVLSAKKVISDSMGQLPDGIAKALSKRLRILIDQSQSKIFPRCYCPNCGNDLKDDFFVCGQISFCSCGSLFFPAASPEIAEAMGKTAALSSGWECCVDEFIGYYVVLRRRAWPSNYKAVRNICPYCRMEFALQVASIAECRCGAVAVPNYCEQQQLKRLAEGILAESTLSKPKIRRMFGFWNPEAPRVHKNGVDLESLKWLLSANLDNFTSHHFVPTPIKKTPLQIGLEASAGTSPQTQLNIGESVFSDLEKLMSRICGPSQSQENVKRVVVTCTPEYFHIQVTLKHNPEDLVIKEWSKISSIQWIQKDLRYSFKYVRGIKNVEG